MILIEAVGEGRRALEARLILVAQLAARGYHAVIDGRRVAPDARRGLVYEATRYALDPQDISADAMILLGAERLSLAALEPLLDAPLRPDTRIIAIGRFANRQDQVSVTSRIAHAFHREPDLVDLSALLLRPLVTDTLAPPMVLSVPPVPPAALPRLGIVVAENTEVTPDFLRQIEMLHHQRRVRVALLGDSRLRDRLNEARRTGADLIEWGELSPLMLARRFDILWTDGPAGPASGETNGNGKAAGNTPDGAAADAAPAIPESLAALIMAMLGAGRIVIDATATEILAQSGAPVLRGPVSLAALSAYLDTTVLPALGHITAQVRESHWLSMCGFERLEELLNLPAPAPLPAALTNASEPRAIFMPTNGVGLGHAQRTSVIAAEMGIRDRTVFAAFPSCLPMIAARGFAAMPLVAKSPTHPGPSDNDLLNYIRLSRLARPGDTFVFDGGYIFDSVWRVLHERNLRGIWIRRGLWKPEQIGRPNQRRETAFERVIVPGEAFDELNDPISFGPHVHAVGPVVQPWQGDRPALRAKLAEATGLSFQRLVVTMLGAGVVADRAAQLQSLAVALDRRSDVLHLIVIWPGAVVQAGLHGFARTRLVQTRDAAGLMVAADLAVSAVGYNSFHEAMYNRVPTIFVPQIASMMDDQARRARAAVDRGLALMVAPSDLLSLRRNLDTCLDGDGPERMRASLARADLPATGTAAAARLIREVMER
ncbi:MAG: glycosyltransferase [Paracoccaceae bacterium]